MSFQMSFDRRSTLENHFFFQKSFIGGCFEAFLTRNARRIMTFEFNQPAMSREQRMQSVIHLASVPAIYAKAASAAS
jgi:hypothetical protein